MKIFRIFPFHFTKKQALIIIMICFTYGNGENIREKKFELFSLSSWTSRIRIIYSIFAIVIIILDFSDSFLSVNTQFDSENCFQWMSNIS